MNEDEGIAGTYLRLAVVPVIWGGTFIAGRVLALAVPATVGATLRFVAASAALLTASLLLEGRLPRLDRRQLAATLALGATGVFAYNLLFLGALTRMPASRTSLIVALNPVVTIALSAWLFEERMTRLRLFGILLALAGVWTVVTRGDPLGSLAGAVGPGEVMMFGAVCSWAAYTLIGRGVLRGLTPLAASTYASLFGTAMLAAVAMPDLLRLDGAVLSPAAIASVLYLGLLGTGVAFVWYYRAVQRLGPSRTVIFNNLVPIFGAGFGVTLLGEPLLPSMVVGGALAVTGVMLVSRG
jgi:drug/metabolite transporter (DMT)-like permease